MSNPKIKYRAQMGKITPVEILRETGQSVFLQHGKLGERREAKRSDWTGYFDTWPAAHAFLMEQAQGKVNAARRSLELANAALGNIKGMKPLDGVSANKEQSK